MSDIMTDPQRPVSNFNNYTISAERAISSFVQDNMVIKKAMEGQFTMNDYHGLLLTIFHQVFYSSTSFALAGALSTRIDRGARDYLMHHAEEEKTHWAWILEDLQATGYKGPDPRAGFPHWAAQSYLSYGVYLAVFMPLGRLAMAHVLEGVSGRYGLEMGAKVLGQLKLKKEQAKFFLAHGELDQGHTQDIVDVLKTCSISQTEWAEMENVCATTSQLYKNLYNASQMR